MPRLPADAIADTFLVHIDSFVRDTNNRKIDNDSSNTEKVLARNVHAVAKSMYTKGFASILVLMINYQDASVAISAPEMEKQIKLCSKFHYENSFGQFSLNRQVISPVIQLSKNLKYYASKEPWIVLREARETARETIVAIRFYKV